MSNLFLDNFTRANGAVGATNYATGVTTWTVASNQLATTANGSGAPAYCMTTTAAHAAIADVDCSVDTANIGSTWDGGPCVRRTAATTFYALEQWLSGAQWKFEIYKYNGSGSGTLVATANISTPSSGATIKLRASGTTLTGYINGVSTVSGTDSTLSAAGQCGLHWWGAAITAFDNLSVDSLAAGGTANTVSLTGSLTMSGALAKQGRKPLAGALTLAGALAKQAAKPLAGSLAMAGSLAKQAAKPLAGGITLAGTFAKQAGKALSGGLTLGGASIVKAVGKPLAGGLALGGALAKRTAKGLSGALTLSGAFAATRVILIAFAGTITLSGALTKRTGKGLSGALAMGGTLAKACAKGLAGSLALSGSLAKQTAKGFAGAIALSGALAKRAGKAFAGALSLAGSLSKLFTAGGGGGGGASAWYYRLTQWQWRRRR